MWYIRRNNRGSRPVFFGIMTRRCQLMTLRKTIFWTHLAAGVVASIVIVMLCVTGVLLTYDRQIKDWADHELLNVEQSDAPRLTVDELVAAAAAAGARPSTVTMRSDPDKLPTVTAGRRDTSYVNPYTGELLGAGNTAYRDFSSTIVAWHRYFATEGESRPVGSTIVDLGNLVFFFLVVTGLYLWLPPLYRWAVVRPRLFFNDKANNAKARDYNWHHVFGFWSLIPLFFIAASGLTLSYAWSDKVVYFLVGDDSPVQSGPRAVEQISSDELQFDTASFMPLHDHFEFAASQSNRWQRIDVSVPKPDEPTVNVVIDEGTGGEPLKKRTLILHRNSGEILKVDSFADRSRGSWVVGYFRWLHTGEALGIVGQTIAGIVSALAVLMTWTGLALAWRRLVSPLLRRRAQSA